MKKVFRSLILWGISGLAMLLSSCVEPGNLPNGVFPQDSESVSYEEYFETTTNSDGRTTLTVGGTEIEVTVTDDEGFPLEGIKVTGYDLGNGKILVIAEDPNDNYFRDFKLIDVENRIAATTIVFGLIAAYNIGSMIYDYVTDPSEFPVQIIEALDESDKVVKEVRLQVDVEDLLNLVGLIGSAGQLAKTVNVFGAPARLRGVTAIKMGFLKSKLFADIADTIKFQVALTAIESVIGQLSDKDIINVTLFKFGEEDIPIAKVEIEYGADAEVADYRFVLMWLEQPRDLDAHMRIFNENSLVSEIYWLNRGSKESYPYVQLDVDDTDSWGPENIFVWNFMNSHDYVFFVHNYSGET
ncbi:MAG: hypothetical protein J7L63_03925, partial [Thermoplasmata archaeon]|nr:hypothetical protein [Thermoplasmata archaeon]